MDGLAGNTGQHVHDIRASGLRGPMSAHALKPGCMHMECVAHGLTSTGMLAETVLAVAQALLPRALITT